MNDDVFWSIIEASRNDALKGPLDGCLERQAYFLEKKLKKLKKEEMREFYSKYNEIKNKLYTWDLWGAALIICGGFCSDDSFDDFRNWIISMGKPVTDLALSQPDDLGPASTHESVEDFRFPEFGYVINEVHNRKMSNIISRLFKRECEGFDTNFDLPEPKGKKWEVEELDHLYPKLTAQWS